MSVRVQYFTDAEANEIVSSTAAYTGGFSQAMDFAPVRISYMNCQDVDVVGGNVNLNTEVTNASSVNFTQLNTGAAVREAGLFGGQCKCKVHDH
jgi:hypothetical protein